MRCLPNEKSPSMGWLIMRAARRRFSRFRKRKDTLLRLRGKGRIDDEVMRTLERELDLTASRKHLGSLLLH